MECNQPRGSFPQAGRLPQLQTKQFGEALNKPATMLNANGG
jgi:hypothetical protein